MLAAVRARHIVAALVAVGFALCGAVEVSSSVALLANQKDNHAIIDTSWHCDMLVNISSRNRTEDFEIIFMEVYYYYILYIILGIFFKHFAQAFLSNFVLLLNTTINSFNLFIFLINFYLLMQT